VLIHGNNIPLPDDEDHFAGTGSMIALLNHHVGMQAFRAG